VLGKQPEIAVTFSGHTHGMQFGVDTRFYRWSPVKLLYKEWLDLYSEGDQHLYVNRGFGYLGYPGRIGVFPEISVFTLQAV
jgi:predicted MPP superfamily phosphohydrolase